MMKKALVILSPGFEEIEAITIIDLLRRAHIDVVTVGLEPQYITGSHGITVICDAQPNEINPEDFDALILPGGQPGTNNMKINQYVLAWLRDFNSREKMIAAICAAPAVLDTAGIINGKKITSFPAEKYSFQNSVYKEENVVIDDHIITSRGAGTAIEFSLTVIEILSDKKTRDELAERIIFKK